MDERNKICINGQILDLSTPKVMGILNLTPDSFYDGGRYDAMDKALSKVEDMLLEGADFIDLGAYSSRPNALHISEKEEVTRVVPILKAIVRHYPEALLSIDTFRASVAKTCIEAGAHMVNDISGGELDNNMLPVVAEFGVPYVLMHMKGSPQTMLQEAVYENLFQEVCYYFTQKIAKLNDFGIYDIIIDPGFGFAKTITQNYVLLSKLDQLRVLGLPILAGLSRKSLIYKTLGVSPENALNGTTVLNTIALSKGANILRVHDVKEAIECINLLKNLGTIKTPI